jgi:xanthine dehydrogenase accessory factor
MTPQTLASLLAAREAGQAVVLATRLGDGHQILLPREDASPDVQAAAALALGRDESRTVELGDDSWFLHVHAPAFRLIVVGAVHIAQALAPLAATLGYAVTIVDPRRSFATAERFPGVSLLHDWPDTALDSLRPDARTGIVTLTHDPKLDDPALDRALRSEALFIGALGSRKTHAARLERLGALGHSAADLARIRGPVGLALGAVSAPEIALSIVAELVATRRGAALGQR